MANPFLGEIRIIAFNLAPAGWAFCNGQFLPINQNQALFSLLGTMYGGNGQTTFALPDFRGRAPLHVSAGFIQGQQGGQESHTVTASEMPMHNHFMSASTAAVNAGTPLGNMCGVNAPNSLYGGTVNAAMAPQSMTSVGGSQPHENRQPFLVLNFIIALIGIFPTQN